MIKISTGNMGPGVSIRSGFFRIGEEQLTPSIYSPVALGFVADYAIKTVSREKTGGGVPRDVLLYQTGGIEVRYRFEDGAVAGAPTYADEVTMRSRLQMVDAEGWSCTNNPAYYDLYPGDGEMYRFVAATNSEDYLQLVLHRDVTGREETLGQIGVELVRDTDGLLRQVLVPTRLCDVVVSNEWEYAIKFYRRTDVGTEKNGEGLYEPASNAVPVEEWVISNPEPTTLTRLRVAQSVGGKTNIYDYVYEPDSGSWDLTSGGGLKKQSLEKVWNDSQTMRYETHTTRGLNGEIVERIREKIQDFSMGAGVVESVDDPDGAALTKSYTYDSAARTKTKLAPDGNWGSYTYDSIGRKTIEVTPWMDSPFDSPANSSRATYYDYAPVVAGDAVLFNDQRPRTVTEKVLGVTVAKTYHAYVTNSVKELQEIEKKCVTWTATYGDTNNICTVRTYYGTNVPNHKIGRLKSIEYPDGRLDSFDYEYGIYHASTNPADCWFEADPDGEAWRETVTHGTVDHPDGIEGETTREMKILDNYNQVVLSETHVYVSGMNYERIAWTAREFDDYYHPIHVYRSTGEQMDGSWGGNCCGKEWEKTADGVETTYGHDLFNRLVLETKKGTNSPSDDIVKEYSLDAVGRNLTEKISGEMLSLLVSSNVYDRAGRTISTMDSAGLVTTYSYQNGEGIRTEIRPGNATNITEPYFDGQMKSMNGNVRVAKTYDYGVNADGTRWTKVYSGSAGEASPTWIKTPVDLLGRTIREEEPGFDGAVVTNSNFYNSKNQLVKRTSTGQADMLYEYNELGERVRFGMDVDNDGTLNVGELDRVTETESSYVKESGDWFRVTVSKVWAVENDATPTTNSVQKTRLTGLGSSSENGILTAETILIDRHGNPSIRRTEMDRAARERTQLTEDPDSTNKAVSVTINGLIVSTRAKSGLEYGYVYDGLGRKVGEVNPRTGLTATHYNDKNQVDWTEDAALNRTLFGYDPTTGRRISVTDPLTNTVHTVYNDRGQMVGTWGATYPVAYEFDEFDRMVAMYTYRGTNAIGSYEDLVNLKPDMDDTKWLYDEATGLLTNKVYSDGKGPSYTYTADGKLQTRKWARNVDGQVLMTTYSYTNTGEMVAINYSDAGTPDVTYEYTRLGQQKRITDGVGVHVLDYNTTLDLEEESVTGVENGTITRLYSESGMIGRPVGFRLNDGYDVGYGFDGVGRMDSVVWSNGQANGSVQYSYLPGSELLAGWQETNTGFQVSRQYEANRDLLTVVSNAYGKNAISVFEYQNDEVGRRTRRVDVAESGIVATNDFGYNLRSEVTDAKMGTNVFGYRYDPIGNRIESSNNAERLAFQANRLNQYTNIQDGVVKNPTYDLDGNLTNDGVFAYLWDGENRLVGVEPLELTNGAKKIECAYDYQSRRVSKVVSVWSNDDWLTVQTNLFLYDGWNMIAETINSTTNNSATNLYVWGLDLSGSLQGAGGIGGLLAAVFGSAPEPVEGFYAFDANGNVSDVINADSGAIAAHYEYSPFGETVVQAGDEQVLALNPYAFSTKHLDRETKLYCYGLRYYSPEMGRFPSRDPLTYALGSDAIFTDYLQRTARQQLDLDSRLAFDLDSILSEVERQVSPDNRAQVKQFVLRMVKKQEQQIAQTKLQRVHVFSYVFVGNNPVNSTDLLGLYDCGFCKYACMLDPFMGDLCLRSDMVCNKCCICPVLYHTIGFSKGLFYWAYVHCTAYMA
jgi:RHS repeat-associated protein